MEKDIVGDLCCQSVWRKQELCAREGEKTKERKGFVSTTGGWQ